MPPINRINAKLFYIQKTTINSQENLFLEPSFNEITHIFTCTIEEVGAERIPSSEGIEQSILLAEGRLINPRLFPPFVDLQREMAIEWEKTRDKVVKGVCTLRPRITSRLSLENIFNEKIRLHIKVNV